MTAFGKILVFMNLVFSVLTGALIVFVFTTRANWKSAYEDAQRKAVAAESAYKAEKSSHESDLKQKEAAATALTSEIATLKTAVAQANADAATAKEQARLLETRNTTDNTNQQKIQAELEQNRNERASMAKEIDEKKALIINVQKQLDTERGTRILAELNARTLTQKNSNLLRQYEETLVRVRELEQSGILVGGPARGGKETSILTPPPKPAPPGVSGRVTQIGGPGTNLAQINIGSDSGISPGNELIVYRGDVFVGTLLITQTEPKAAVGKFTPSKSRELIKSEDAVITSFERPTQQ